MAITVETAAAASEPMNVTMQAASPEIFSVDGSGRNQGAISFAGTADIVTERSFRVAGYPAQAGDEIQIWGTGLGSAVRVRLGESDAEVGSVRAVPGSPGLYTVQLRVPPGISFGDAIPVQVRVSTPDGKLFRSNSVNIAVEAER